MVSMCHSLDEGIIIAVFVYPLRLLLGETLDSELLDRTMAAHQCRAPF
jgi:hypothetical protein